VHAVVVNVSISDFEGGRKMLEEEVVPRVKQAPGFVAGYWTRSEDNSGLSMMVFESEDAARGAAEFIRSQTPQSEAVTLENVEVREVVASA
jgi:hypothetical protein